MRTLNLVRKDTSDITYNISKFPDGQQQLSVYHADYSKTDVEIKARINNFMDLELVICAVKSLRSLGCKSISLYTPYMLGSRSDRRFESGGNNYLKDVICPIINSLYLDRVIVLDPHSDVLEACLNNFYKADNFSFIEWVLSELPFDVDLVCPDSGALKKIYSLIDFLGDNYSYPVICSKHRDVNGKLSKIKVPNPDTTCRPLLIVDDICDGGRTFIELSKALTEKGYNRPIYLAVTHGIFSAGFELLNKHFDGIFCTNSYSDLGDSYQLSNGDLKQHKVTQFNIF